MEIALWLRSLEDSFPPEAQRIYIGHESSPDQMPDFQDMIWTFQCLSEANRKATLVTPFLTEKEMGRICNMIEAMAAMPGGFEVVCNDWGLLQWLTESRAAEPVVGRLLVGQATDPRLAAIDSPETQRLHERFIQHADGTKVELHYKRPTEALMTHLRSCSIATADVLAFLHDLGVRRFEVSNPLQGLQITPVPGWHVTLHLPEAPVAIARHRWKDIGKKWLRHDFPVGLCQQDNMVFYRNDEIPVHIDKHGIDRLVYRSPRAV